MKRKKGFFLFSIILLAFILRAIGISWGLPETYHPDEPYMLDFTYNMLKGNWNPINFSNRPFVYGPVLMGITALIGKFLLLINSILKINLPDQYNIIFLGRLLIIIFSCINAYIVYKFCSIFLKNHFALLASLFFALSYSHIIHSHYYTTDVFVSFLITLSLFFIQKIYEEKNVPSKFYFFVGLFSALAFCTKFTAAILLFPIAAAFSYAYLQKNHKKIKGFLILTLTGITTTFLILNYFFIPFSNIKLAYKQLITNALGIRVAEWGCIYPNLFLFYSNVLFLYFKPFLGFLILPSLLYFLIKCKMRAFVLSAFIIPFFIIHCLTRNFSDRYLLPLVPLISIILAISVSHIYQSNKIKIIKSLIFFLILAQLGFSFYYALRIDAIFSIKDTRIISKEWINLFVAKGSKLAIEIQGPRIKRNRVKTAKVYQKPMQFFEMRGVDYFIISNLFDESLLKFMDCSQRFLFYKNLEKEHKLVKSFTLEKMGFLHPEIKIIKSAWSKQPSRFQYNFLPRFELCKNKIIFLKNSLYDECLGGFYIRDQEEKRVLVSPVKLEKIKLYLINQGGSEALLRIRSNFKIKKLILKPDERKLIELEPSISFPFIKYYYEIKFKAGKNAKIYCKIILDEFNEAVHLWNLGQKDSAVKKLKEALLKEKNNLLMKYIYSLFLFSYLDEYKAKKILKELPENFIQDFIIINKINYSPDKKEIRFLLNSMPPGAYNLILNVKSLDAIKSIAVIKADAEHSIPVSINKGINKIALPFSISFISAVNIKIKGENLDKLNINSHTVMLNKEKTLEIFEEKKGASRLFPKSF